MQLLSEKALSLHLQKERDLYGIYLTILKTNFLHFIFQEFNQMLIARQVLRFKTYLTNNRLI